MRYTLDGWMDWNSVTSSMNLPRLLTHQAANPCPSCSPCSVKQRRMIFVKKILWNNRLPFWVGTWFQVELTWLDLYCQNSFGYALSLSISISVRLTFWLTTRPKFNYKVVMGHGFLGRGSRSWNKLYNDREPFWLQRNKELFISATLNVLVLCNWEGTGMREREHLTEPNGAEWVLRQTATLWCDAKRSVRSKDN